MLFCTSQHRECGLHRGPVSAFEWIDLFQLPEAPADPRGWAQTGGRWELCVLDFQKSQWMQRETFQQPSISLISFECWLVSHAHEQENDVQQMLTCRFIKKNQMWHKHKHSVYFMMGKITFYCYLVLFGFTTDVIIHILHQPHKSTNALFWNVLNFSPLQKKRKEKKNRKEKETHTAHT